MSVRDNQANIDLFKVTMQALEKREKYVQCETYQNDANGVILVSLLLTLNIFYAFF